MARSQYAHAVRSGLSTKDRSLRMTTMSNRIFHINEDGSLHEGALDHDVQMIVENEIINFLAKYRSEERRVGKDCEWWEWCSVEKKRELDVVLGVNACD